MRDSHRFIDAKWQLVKVLREKVLPINAAGAKTAFCRLIPKLIADLGGEIKPHSFVSPRGTQYHNKEVIMFKDGSFARKPHIRELETLRPFRSEISSVVGGMVDEDIEISEEEQVLLTQLEAELTSSLLNHVG